MRLNHFASTAAKNGAGYSGVRWPEGGGLIGNSHQSLNRAKHEKVRCSNIRVKHFDRYLRTNMGHLLNTLSSFLQHALPWSRRGCPIRASHQGPWAERSAPAALRRRRGLRSGGLWQKGTVGSSTAGKCGGGKSSCLRTLAERRACLVSCSFLLRWPLVLTAQAGSDHRGLVD